jgi:hypothetical protein
MVGIAMVVGSGGQLLAISGQSLLGVPLRIILFNIKDIT